MENIDKNLYELGYLLIPIISAEKLSEEAGVIRSYIESNGGVVTIEELPKMRKLAYEIAHRIAGGKSTRYDDAHFGWVKFDLSPEMVKKVEAELKKNSSILRYLIINLTKEMGSPLRNDSQKPLTIKKPRKTISETEIDKEIDSLLEKGSIASNIKV